MRFLHLLLGALVAPPPPRDQRGLSQSTENAILLAGAVTVALIVITPEPPRFWCRYSSRSVRLP